MSLPEWYVEINQMDPKQSFYQDNIVLYFTVIELFYFAITACAANSNGDRKQICGLYCSETL